MFSLTVDRLTDWPVAFLLIQSKAHDSIFGSSKARQLSARYDDNFNMF